MGGRESHVGQHVEFGRVHQGGELGDLGPQLIGDLAPLHPGRLGVVLSERGGDEGRHDVAARVADMGGHVPHEVDAAALPGGVNHLGHRGLAALVAVRDHELAQEGSPKRLGFRRADVPAENLAPAIGVHADRHDHRHRDNPAVLANLHVGRTDPEIRPLALNGALEERTDPFVDLLAQPADLAFRHARAALRRAPSRPAAMGPSLDQIIHRANRDALDVGLLDHRRERPSS